MEFLTAFSLAVICAAACLVYRWKRRKRSGYMVFQKRKLSHVKRRRHSLLDRERGKIIPFPSGSSSAGQGSGQPDSWQSKK
ncbi:MAG: hypothetical protein ACOX27_01320 [Caldicoprobacterales bacterium]|jgi:hypothetical protein|nr:hypothetical protein [Clostridiales bacterium]